MPTRGERVMSEAVRWSGEVVGIQPRIRLLRSFDERQHSYLGYRLRVSGTLGGEDKAFSVGVGTAAQAKHAFRVGDTVEGRGHPVADPRVEVCELYRASGLRLVARPDESGDQGSAPYRGVPPSLEVYRARGHRRLAARTYATRCTSCVWGCEMTVEMIIDPWNPRVRRYRRETFCYGPKTCPLYRPGPTRKVPGRKGMTYEEEDWVDEDATAHRGEAD